MIKVYNTLSGKKEEFKPIEDGKVNMYVCGLTVQNYSHLGHIRSAINYDVMRRYLEYKGYDVTYVQNFTDINEKIIKRAEEENLSPRALAEKYRKAYLEDLENMNIKKADIFCSATKHIEEIQEMTQTLIDKDFAYEANGSVYFSVEKFEDYGKLSGQNLEEMEAGSRVAVSKEKKHPLDFALWKKVENKEISWDSPWGKGWPGWHVECSVMSIKYLGQSFDIHGGGTDLIFPHHENEIAQSEAYSGRKPFVKYWLHNGTIDIKGEKMSKSLGNFFTTRELLKEFKPDVIRYYVLTKHYHSPIDFTLEDLKKARISVERLVNTWRNIRNLLQKDNENDKNSNFSYEKSSTMLKEKRKKFEEAMDDDFNSARAIGVIHELATDINKSINKSDFVLNEKSRQFLKETDELFMKLTKILGLNFDIMENEKASEQLVNDLIEYIVDIRKEARDNKDYKTADKIRADLQDMGIELKDTPHGVEWMIREEEIYGG